MNSRRRGLLGRVSATVTGFALVAAAFVAVPAEPAAAAPAQGTGTGYLRTQGSRILDATGAEVQLTGINWFGMETDNKTFHGLWSSVPWRDQLNHMAELGFNTLRIPYTGDALRTGARATGINDFINPDLIGLHPLEILDKVIDQAGSLGMRVILDRHRVTAAGQTPLWYTGSVSEADIIADWQLLARRYAGNTTVVGADLFNEPHAQGTEPNATGACWGCGDPARDWRLAAERIGNAIHSVNSDWLIIVEGVSCLSGGTPNVWDDIPDDPMACTWWGGNLAGVRDDPVRLQRANKLVYSAHDYGISVYDRQPWFDVSRNPDFPANLPAVWDHFWGYIHTEGIAPVLVGEFGSTLRDPQDVQWLNSLVSYIDRNNMSFTYWSWNPNSGDTGGIVGDDWATVDQRKYSILRPALVPPVPSSGTPGPGTPDPGDPGPGDPGPGDPGDPGDPGMPGAAACTAVVDVVNSWPGGYQGSVSVTNTGSAAVNPWTISFTVPAGVSIGNGWNGTYSQTGGTVTVTAPAWATTLASGATIAVGFVASGTSSPAPSAVALNRVACS